MSTLLVIVVATACVAVASYAARDAVIMNIRLASGAPIFEWSLRWSA